MHEDRRAFLESLLATPSPSGFETAGQRVWVNYVREFADQVETDAYGNAVATYEGSGDTSIAFTGHADEVGYIVRRIDENGYLHISPIGAPDESVSRGQQVQVHTDDGAVTGVIGQTAIHLRERDEETHDDIVEQHVDIGAEDRDRAVELVSVGDPATIRSPVAELADGRFTARGIDNRVGTWAAAEGLRRAVADGVDATVHAVSTVQEEVGADGAAMVGDRIDADAVVVVDVTHATDHPGIEPRQANAVDMGSGAVVSRGKANHPAVVALARTAADAAGVDTQTQAVDPRVWTDADTFYTAQGGIPSIWVGVPNRYMHTPVEVVDESDLDAVADLLGSMAGHAADHAPFAVDL